MSGNPSPRLCSTSQCHCRNSVHLQALPTCRLSSGNIFHFAGQGRSRCVRLCVFYASEGNDVRDKRQSCCNAFGKKKGPGLFISSNTSINTGPVNTSCSLLTCSCKYLCLVYWQLRSRHHDIKLCWVHRKVVQITDSFFQEALKYKKLLSFFPSPIETKTVNIVHFQVKT